MNGWRKALAGVVSLAVVACGRQAPPQEEEAAPATPPEQEPPVALNPDSPIQYPPKLYDQKVEGDVVLRLFVDSTGRLAPESSRVAESSGYPALDSAALAGARKLRFAPARQRGVAVAAAFLQPIEFRHRGTEGAAGAAGAAATGRATGGGGSAGVGSPGGGGGGGGGARAAVTIGKPDTSKVRRDTSRSVRRQPAPPRLDTAPPRPDTSSAPPETTWARPDTGAGAH